MMNSLRIFGPDRENFSIHDHFGLSWAMDTGYTPQDEYEHQPISISGRWSLVFTGFLMHREELSEKLELKPSDAITMPDGVLAAKAWEKWQQKCLTHLYGQFSFIICDIRDQQLYAVRGVEGGPTIHYYKSNNRMIFSTSPRAIFCFPDIEKKIDEIAIADMLVLNFEDHERSFFENIKSLPSGHFLRVDHNGDTINSYYDLRATKQINYNKDAEYVEHARSLFFDAVKSTMRANETPAISLSAGLDSTSVAINMLEYLAQYGTTSSLPVKAYVSVPSAAWDGRISSYKLGDESGPVRELMKAYPELDVEFVESKGDPFDYEMDHFMRYTENPVRGVWNHNWGLEIGRKCKADGRQVLLTGSSGNFGLSFSAAQLNFAKWFRQGRWLHMFREYRAYMQNNPNLNQRGYMGLLSSAIPPNLPGNIYDIYTRLRQPKSQLGFHNYSAIHPDYAQDIGLAQRLNDFAKDDRYRPPTDRKEFLSQKINGGVRHHSGGQSEASKAMMGVQGRDPLGDRKILEFCYAIPDDQFYKGGVDRLLIKNVMSGRLPDAVLSSPRGDQSADWHSRMNKKLDQVKDELICLSEDPIMSQRLDIKRMQAALETWPNETPLSVQDHPDLKILRYGIGRAISVARFISQAEGKNR